MDKKQTIIILACVLGVLVLIVGIIIGIRSCNNDQNLVPASSSTTTSVTAATSSSSDATTTEEAGPTTETGEGPVISDDPTESTTENGSGETDSTTKSTTKSTSSTTKSTSATSKGTSATTTEDGVIELPFVPAE